MQRATLTWLGHVGRDAVVAHGLYIMNTPTALSLLERSTALIEDGAHTQKLLAAGSHYSRLWAAHTHCVPPKSLSFNVLTHGRRKPPNGWRVDRAPVVVDLPNQRLLSRTCVRDWRLCDTNPIGYYRNCFRRRN